MKSRIKETTKEIELPNQDWARTLGEKENNNTEESSSSSCCSASTYLLEPLFRVISCIGTELLYIGSMWSSCLCSSMWRGQQEYIAYEFVFTSPAVSRRFGWTNFDNYRDRGSSSLCRAASTDLTELLFIGSNWSSCLCSSMWRGP